MPWPATLQHDGVPQADLTKSKDAWDSTADLTHALLQGLTGLENVILNIKAELNWIFP